MNVLGEAPVKVSYQNLYNSLSDTDSVHLETDHSIWKISFRAVGINGHNPMFVCEVI
jgi:hypothetical protein